MKFFKSLLVCFKSFVTCFWMNWWLTASQTPSKTSISCTLSTSLSQWKPTRANPCRLYFIRSSEKPKCKGFVGSRTEWEWTARDSTEEVNQFQGGGKTFPKTSLIWPFERGSKHVLRFGGKSSELPIQKRQSLRQWRRRQTSLFSETSGLRRRYSQKSCWTWSMSPSLIRSTWDHGKETITSLPIPSKSSFSSTFLRTLKS